MSKSKNPWWTHIFLATVIAGGFAAIPFWTRGLSLELAELAAIVIFPSIIVAYILIVREK
jgi:hypothetical protein